MPLWRVRCPVMVEASVPRGAFTPSALSRRASYYRDGRVPPI